MNIEIGTNTLQTPALAMDPMADWLMRSVEDITQSDAELHVLIELRAGKTATDLEESVHAGITVEDWAKSLQITPFYRGAAPLWVSARWAQARFLTAVIRPRFLHWLSTKAELQAFIQGITICENPSKRYELSFPLGISTTRKQMDSKVAQGGAVIGVIDHGLPIAHPALRSADGKSRIAAAWFQDREPLFVGGRVIDRTSFGYGSDIFGSQIDGALFGQVIGQTLIGQEIGQALFEPEINRAPVVEKLDEDQFYAAARLFNPKSPATYWTRNRVTHGSAVLGLAAGNTIPARTPPLKEDKNPIIAVQLRDTAVEDGSGHSLAAYALDAMRYIIAEAERFEIDGTQAPLIITMSYGNNAGPHDGNGPLELAMAELNDIWEAAHPGIPFAIVISAGNAYQAQLHARWTRAELQSSPDIDWVIPPDDSTPNILQLWMPAGFTGTPVVTLACPVGGHRITLGVAGNTYLTLKNGTEIIASAQWLPPSPGGHHRGMVQLIVGATGFAKVGMPRAAALAPAGVWKVSVAADLSGDQAIDAWIQRDDMPQRGFRPARQSYFQHEAYTRFRPITQPADGSVEKGPLRRPGSINAIATGAGTVVAGSAFKHKSPADNFPLPLYSGGGEMGGNGVDVVYESDDSLLQLGSIVMGMRGGSTARMFGTSIAAPMAGAHIVKNITDFQAHAGAAKGKTHNLVAPVKGPGGPLHPRMGKGRLP